jgi:hypothetical protein
MKTLHATCLLVLATAFQASAGDLQGTVTRSDSGAAVPAARVAIRGTDYKVIADMSGHYSFSNIPDGSYGLSCAASGLRAAFTGAVWIGAGTVRDFSLDPPGADTSKIYGIASCGGSPCAGVLLYARAGNNVRGRGLSGPDGSYDVVGLGPGGYQLQGLAYGHLPVTAVFNVPDDGVPHDLELNLNLQAGGTYAVTGVVGLSDNPLDRSGSTVRCNGQSPALSAATTIGGSYRLEGVPAGPLSFTASKSGYLSSTRIDELISGDQTVNFALSKDENGQTDPRYTISGTVALQIPDGGNPASPLGSRVSVWEVEGDFHATDSTDPDGNYSIGGLPSGRYQAGAAREGFSSQTTDPFDLSANRTENFTLQLDPDYDWGPGAEGDDAGCSCGGLHRPGSSPGAGGPAGEAFPVLLLAFLWRRIWRRR